MSTRAIAIGLFSLLCGRGALAAPKACDVELTAVANTGVYGVSFGARGVLDIARGAGAHPNLLSLRWSGRLNARKAHAFLIEIFPARGFPRLNFTYHDDLKSEFSSAGVPKLRHLYAFVFKHNLRNWRQIFAPQEGELRVGVEADQGILRSLSLTGDLNDRGGRDEDEHPPVEAPAMVMLQFERTLLDHADFARDVARLIAATADDPALSKNVDSVMGVLREGLPK